MNPIKELCNRLGIASSAILTLMLTISPGTGVMSVAVSATSFILLADEAGAQSVRGNTRQSARSTSRNARQSSRQVDRTPANDARNVARNANQASRQVSRNTKQSARQISRRHFYTLPSGYRWVTRGAYRYCYYQNRYYYPYMHGGQTVYIEVDVDSDGEPLPPPPAEEVIEEG